ncbi:conjugative transposon protein TraJ [Olivibacter jilunii]|uniref:conjugative transposon protein TraJ n=1 Tax=Olivibacter jilunii TaxID=985016 RepID=UPI001030E3E6|nr:conjugative transposon protein TraJ [Olivibacter jilunii]
MKWYLVVCGLIFCCILSPLLVFAQPAMEKINSLHGVLDSLYEEMIPMCSDLINIGRAIGAFGALFYIGSRVWRHIANSEPIDFYPLFRPFVLGFCISFYPLTLGLLRGILEPTVEATAGMVKDSDKAVKVLLKQKEEAILKSDAWQMYVGQNNMGDRDKWLRYTLDIGDDEPLPSEGMLDRLGNNIKFAFAKASYNVRNSIKEVLSEILQIIFQAAALCLNTLRTFHMIILGILGPLVFGLAIFDGMQQSLTAWLAKYINVYLWLPVCNIFGAIIGKIQEKMLALDLQQIGSSGDTFFSAQDTAYLIFMLIGILGYTTVPSVAGFIVNAGGGGALMQKVTGFMVGAAGAVATQGGSLIAKGIAQATNLDNFTGSGGFPGKVGNSGQGNGSGQSSSGASPASMAGKLDDKPNKS